jgi:phage baseplate assembly protein W
MDKTAFGFPFSIDGLGQVDTMTGDENIRAKIIQVLLTTPGERINLPEFGCGLRDLIFDPNNEILSATTEFNVNQALQRWMGDEIVVEGVDISSEEDALLVEVSYIRRDRLERNKVKISF